MDPYSPEGIAARFRILDLLALYAHAVDRRRWYLMEKIFHDDAICVFSIFNGPWREFIDSSEAGFKKALTYTQHQLGNFLINFEGDSVAHTEIYCTAYHRVNADAPSGGTFGGTGEVYDLISGIRYVDRFELREGSWGIAERRALGDWRHIQENREGTLPTVPLAFRGQLEEEERTGNVVARWRE